MSVADSEAPTQDFAKRTEGLPGHGGFAGVVVSEWTKLRSLRSTLWCLGSAAVIVLLLGAALVTAAARPAPAAAVQQGLTGFLFGQFGLVVLGVLMITNEYSSGMIKTSLVAVPLRGQLLAAKALVFAAVSFTSVLVLSFGCFFLAKAMFVSHDVAISLADSGVLPQLVLQAVFVTMVGLIGLSAGTVAGSTAGAVTAMLGLTLVFPLILLITGTRVGTAAIEFLPMARVGANNFMGTETTPVHGALVLGCWLAASYLAAMVALRRRDA